MNLDDLLSGSEPKKQDKKDPLFGIDALQLTEYAWDKAYAYAKLACDIHGDSIECGGYLVKSKKSEDRVAEDAFLAKDQDVQAGLFTINAEDVIKAGRELDKKGYQVLGWWHSHGYLDTFFSKLDDSGQMTCLNEISAFNYVAQSQRQELGTLETEVDGNKLIVWDKKSPGKKYEIEFSGKNKLAIAKMAIESERRIGFSYGLVVNAKKAKKRKPYAEIAVRDLCNSCRRSRDLSLEVEVELYEDEKKLEIDEDALRKEVKAKVKMPSKGIFAGIGKFLGGGSTVRKNYGGVQDYRQTQGGVFVPYGGTTYVTPGGSQFIPGPQPKQIPIGQPVKQESPQELEEKIKLFCEQHPEKVGKGDIEIQACNNKTIFYCKPSGSNKPWKYLCDKSDLPELPSKKPDANQKQLPLEGEVIAPIDRTSSPAEQAPVEQGNSVQPETPALEVPDFISPIQDYWQAILGMMRPIEPPQTPRIKSDNDEDFIKRD